MIITASALADFAFCPRLYYIKHVLKKFKWSPGIKKGVEAHRKTQEIKVELELGGVKIKGRADFVEGNKVIELKTSKPTFWISHVTQASVYALGLGKSMIEIDYRNLGLRLSGRALELENLVRELVKAHETGVFRKNLKHCSMCFYRDICRVVR